MKIDRLLAILTTLLQREHITAPELARRLEVTRRTISRDIDTLCRAGFPIVTRQGAGGGISLSEGYKLDRSALTQQEMQSILIGLRGLESVKAAPRVAPLLGKLAGVPGHADVTENVVIDLSSHYRAERSEKISLLRDAIAEQHAVAFDYYSGRGQEKRRVEPILLLYKWDDWYLSAFCLDRQDFRLFKLRRLWSPRVLPETFVPRPLPEEHRDFDGGLHDSTAMAALFDPSVLHILVESYSPNCWEVQADGRVLLRYGYTNPDYIVRWLLGFGGAVEVLEPPELRQQVVEQARRLLRNHSGQTE